MIKAEITNEADPSKIFPRIMQSIDKSKNRLVVLFANETSGTVLVNEGADENIVGSHGQCWNIRLFKPLHGLLTLKNKEIGE